MGLFGDLGRMFANVLEKVEDLAVGCCWYLGVVDEELQQMGIGDNNSIRPWADKLVQLRTPLVQLGYSTTDERIISDHPNCFSFGFVVQLPPSPFQVLPTDVPVQVSRFPSSRASPSVYQPLRPLRIASCLPLLAIVYRGLEFHPLCLLLLSTPSSLLPPLSDILPTCFQELTNHLLERSSRSQRSPRLPNLVSPVPAERELFA